MTRQTIVTESAGADLVEIAGDITHELMQPEVAQHLIAELTEAILELEQLHRRPLLGRSFSGFICILGNFC